MAICIIDNDQINNPTIQYGHMHRLTLDK